MATQSSLLAWRIPMDRGAWQAIVHGITKSDSTEVPSTAQHRGLHLASQTSVIHLLPVWTNQTFFFPLHWCVYFYLYFSYINAFKTHLCCSVAKSHLTLHDPIDCSMPSFPVPQHLPEFAYCISDAIRQIILKGNSVKGRRNSFL